MKIIIEVKDTATLSRIEEFNKTLSEHHAIGLSFSDVIKSISKEW